MSAYVSTIPIEIPTTQSTALTATGVRHGFFGRRGGLSSGEFDSLNVSMLVGDEEQNVLANRMGVLRAFGGGKHPQAGPYLTLLKQVHSNRVMTLTERPDWKEPVEADAMVTNLPYLLLGILTADCAPVLLADPGAGVIGAAHAGWKGAADKVIGNTVAAMVELGADPARIVAAIGPTISQPNYEVGPDFATALLKKRPRAAPHIMSPRGGIEHFDLPGFIDDELRRAGVTAIDDLALCTYELEAEYFSHRRATHQGTRAGRQISLIALR